MSWRYFIQFEFPAIFRTVAGGSLCLSLCACGMGGRANPSFAVSVSDAKQAIAQMRQNRAPAERPIIVFGGYQDPGFGAHSLAAKLRRAFIDENCVLPITFFSDTTFDRARDRAIEQIQSTYPSDFPHETVEVDVVGISMGGLIARHAARERTDGGRRLRIHRLFTISTPHTGANMAGLPTFDQKQIDMRPGSAFLTDLNADPTTQDFEIVPYGRLEDSIVGIEHIAPTNVEPWWVPNQPFQLSHIMAAGDERIMADILRRLRGEHPLTGDQPVPVPTSSTLPSAESANSGGE